MKGINRLILLLLIIFASCKDRSKNDDKDSEIRFRYYNLEKRGWKSIVSLQKAEDLLYSAAEVPLEYYLLKDLGNQNLTNIDSLSKINEKERIIEFTFEQEDEKDLLSSKFTNMSYEESVKYMSFGIEKDFYAVTSTKDTIPCAGVIFERNYKIAPYQKLVLFFSGINPNEEMQLVYNDHLFRKGVLKFKFNRTVTDIKL